MVTCVDIDGNKHEVPVSKLSWRPSAYGIVIRDGQILLCNHFGKYNLPGGGIDLGETSVNGVIREVKEETGIDVTNPRLVTVQEEFFKAPFDDEHFQTILLYYVCDYAGGELSTDGFDEYEQKYAELAEWVDLKTIDNWQTTSTKDFRVYVKQAIGSGLSLN
jgi:8-oxo-dGTP diphosphatase